MFYYICFDIETGGLDPNISPITEFAVIVYDNEKFEEQIRFETFIKPYDNLKLEQEALKHTGITESMLQEGIEIKDLVNLLVDVFKKYSTGSKRFSFKPILVGHNIAKFDINFLHYAFNKFKVNLYDFVEYYCEDTLFLSRTKWAKEYSKFNLASCCKYAGIELIDAHRAMNDVEANKMLHEYIIKTLRQDSNIQITEKKENNARKNFKF